MPAPPPYGVSSTWPAESGVVARRSTVSKELPLVERVANVALRAKPVKPVRERG